MNLEEYFNSSASNATSSLNKTIAGNFNQDCPRQFKPKSFIISFLKILILPFLSYLFLFYSLRQKISSYLKKKNSSLLFSFSYFERAKSLEFSFSSSKLLLIKFKDIVESKFGNNKKKLNFLFFAKKLENRNERNFLFVLPIV